MDLPRRAGTFDIPMNNVLHFFRGFKHEADLLRAEIFQTQNILASQGYIVFLQVNHSLTR